MYDIVKVKDLKQGDQIIIIGPDGYPKLETVEMYDHDSGLIILITGLDISWESDEISVVRPEHFIQEF